MTSFIEYSNLILDAFKCHPRQQELIDRKKDIIDKLAEHFNLDFKSILFVGFNPAILGIKKTRLYITEADAETVSYLKSRNINIELVEDFTEKFDLIMASDEYLTFADTEELQKEKIIKLCNATNYCLATTLRDYKNLDFKNREFSEPAIIKNNNEFNSFQELHLWDIKDRYSFETYNYQLTDQDSKFCGKFTRRTLFFKQLAKITSDVGSTNFVVHKNLMYKSLIKKNYEHVISIDFN